ncbi:hypothetical protein [Chitinophaga pinensis]|uniref:hypothetical protein n=1 Tax=Chitinophaga pinensis TaxID=79329 RepID=UPI0021BD63F3|nr:hypothetical protein [Chitinophaga pinensis]
MSHVPTGTQLEVSLIGYAPLQQEVSVEKGKVTEIDLQLQVSSTQLKEISITSNQNKFSRRESEQIARLPIKNLENPQVYQVAGKE